MKKIIIYILIVIIVLGGIVLAINIHFNRVDEINNNIIISGNGNEPGWSIQLKGRDINAKNVFADINLDYGEKTYIGSLGKTWQENYDKEFQYRGDVTTPDNSVTKNIIVYFEKKTCTDDAGTVRGLTVSLNLNSEKEYKGCADIK